MSIKDKFDESDVIRVPLWDLILSTNDCYPGCGCDYDVFDMTLERVKSWVSKNDAVKVLDQIDELLAKKGIDVGDIQIQTNFPFQNLEEFEKWLLEWKTLVLESL